MATITLTIPDALLPRVVAALCSSAGLPVTNANAKQTLIDRIKQTVQSVEMSALAQAQPPIIPPDVTGLVT